MCAKTQHDLFTIASKNIFESFRESSYNTPLKMMDAHELSELKGFVADLKADRAAQKEKEKRESWTKYTSLSLVGLAVLTAIATQWGGKYASRILVSLNDATYLQASASDQWSFYQAKSIKQNLYEMRRDQLSDSIEPANANGKAQLEKISARIDKYEKEKTDIQQSAKDLEKKRDEARSLAGITGQKSSNMGLAVSIYQIGIALGSISLVVKKKPLWFLSMILGALATAQMIYAWCC